MKPKTLNYIGFITTFICIVGAFYWANQYHFFNLTLEDQASFISGVVSALAFLWLVIGYFQQNYEIKKNTETLNEQQKELVKQSKAMQNQAASLSNAANSLREYNRPFLTTHFELKGSKELIFFVVENVGIKPAYNVKFQFDPPLEEFAHYKKMDYENFINLEFIPPGYKKEYVISNRIREIEGEKDINWNCKVSIYYEDQNSRQFDEEYSMSFFDSHWKIYDNTPSVKESLDKLTDIMKKMSQDNSKK